jgi:hypothetical protein
MKLQLTNHFLYFFISLVFRYIKKRKPNRRPEGYDNEKGAHYLSELALGRSIAAAWTLSL